MSFSLVEARLDYLVDSTPENKVFELFSAKTSRIKVSKTSHGKKYRWNHEIDGLFFASSSTGDVVYDYLNKKMETLPKFDTCCQCDAVAVSGHHYIENDRMISKNYCLEHNLEAKRVSASPKPVKVDSQDISFFKNLGCKVIPKNKGLQLVISYKKHTIDFWPTSEKFIFRKEDIRGTGRKNLIKYFGD